MIDGSQRTRTAFFYDNTGNSYKIGPWQVVCFASSADVATANGLGIQGQVGDIVVVPPITAAINTDKIAGITLGPADPRTGEVTIVVAGIAEVMCSAAIAWDKADTPLFCGLAETRTSLQTPITNNFEMLLPLDPRIPITYQMALATRTAIAPAAGATANAIYYPIGYPLMAASAKYDVIRVELALAPFYA